MLKVDRTAVICDMAETYHIYDLRLLPARTVAMLACGLKADSRIKTEMAGVKASPPSILLSAMIVDELRAIRHGWFGEKNKPPVYVTDIMENGIADDEPVGFASGEEFEKEWQRRIEGLKK